MNNSMRIQVLNEDIRLRPSSIDGFFQCSYQWGKVFLEGITTIPSARAAIGTSIHKGVEVMWQEAMKAGEANPNKAMMVDAAMGAWKEEGQKGIQFDEDENDRTAAVEIIKGMEAFVEDIVPFTQIPTGVEERFTVKLDHQLVKEISGTVDYITDTTIADVKTSKRKPSVANYTTQQSLYKYLAVSNGRKVSASLIQGVVLKAKPEGMILPADIDVEQAKGLVNIMLDTLDLVMLDKAPIESILRPNPKYYLCDKKYCKLYGNCPATSTKSTKAVKSYGVKI